jgi:uncharacterized protein (TIGR03083 family)
VTTQTAADTWIAVARQVQDQLADTVRGLDADGLARPSACADWNVAQVLGHLGSAAEIGIATLDAALAGRDGPGPEFNQPIWDRWNALDDRAQADGFLEHADDLVARYETLDAATRAELGIKLPYFPAPIDVATLVRLRTSELTHHGWDVRVTFDPTAALHPGAVDLMIDHSGDFLAYIGKAAALGGRSATVAVETTDPERAYALTIADTVSLTNGVPPDPDATLHLPAESWLRLTYGRLRPEHTPASVTLSGDCPTLDDLRRVFPGV